MAKKTRKINQFFEALPDASRLPSLPADQWRDTAGQLIERARHAARLAAQVPGDGTSRVLLKTGAADGALTPEGAAWLVERGVRLVGADTLSIEPETRDYPVHRILLGAGVVIVEGLDLSAAAAGRYQLLCLPLRISGGDGAPARAVLIPDGPGAP